LRAPAGFGVPRCCWVAAWFSAVPAEAPVFDCETLRFFPGLPFRTETTVFAG
jgi:hypothetical protein